MKYEISTFNFRYIILDILKLRNFKDFNMFFFTKNISFIQPSGKNACSGILLNKQYVLTAASGVCNAAGQSGVS